MIFLKILHPTVTNNQQLLKLAFAKIVLTLLTDESGKTQT